MPQVNGRTTTITDDDKVVCSVCMGDARSSSNKSDYCAVSVHEYPTAGELLFFSAIHSTFVLLLFLLYIHRPSFLHYPHSMTSYKTSRCSPPANDEQSATYTK